MVPASPPGKQITPTTWYRQLNKGALKKWRQVSFYRGYQTSLGYAVTRSQAPAWERAAPEALPLVPILHALRFAGGACGTVRSQAGA